jgi:replicative DNA helicase
MGKLIKYMNDREKIGAVFIDYIQRMSTTRRTQDKRTEIAHISDMILQTAKEINRPIILGAQFNRGAKEEREPRLEHLKEAGNLEEDANTVLSVWNESRENDSAEEGNTREVELKIKALKNREGNRARAPCYHLINTPE